MDLEKLSIEELKEYAKKSGIGVPGNITTKCRMIYYLEDLQPESNMEEKVNHLNDLTAVTLLITVIRDFNNFNDFRNYFLNGDSIYPILIQALKYVLKENEYKQLLSDISTSLSISELTGVDKQDAMQAFRDEISEYNNYKYADILINKLKDISIDSLEFQERFSNRTIALDYYALGLDKRIFLPSYGGNSYIDVINYSTNLHITDSDVTTAFTLTNRRMLTLEVNIEELL